MTAGTRRLHIISNPIIAALDLGTNNCRLLIAREIPQRSFQVIDAFSRIVRLGEGVSQTGRLTEQAMTRTIEALKICAEKVRKHHTGRMRAVATEACRQASNSKDFLARIQDETGLEFEVITASEEASLAFRGTMPLIDGDISYAIIFDIGGGSTELGWLQRGKPLEPQVRAWHSMKAGVINMAEKFGADSPNDQAWRDFYEEMVDFAANELRVFARAIAAREKIRKNQVQMIGTSGTVTTLTGIHLKLPKYDRSKVDGMYLDFKTLENISFSLAQQKCVERAKHPCVGQERADLVLAGCAILSAICREWPIGQLRVADRGVREGILMSLMENP